MSAILRDNVFSYVKEQYSKNGYPPSLAAIAAALDLTSRSYIRRQLMQLVTEGRLTKINGKCYPAESAEQLRVVMVPILGTIAAGVPIEAIQDLDGYVGYLPQSHHRGHDLFALHVHGNSMIDAGIYDGDIVIVEQTSVADNGQIVAAMIDGEATVKRFFKEKGHYRLQPENPTMTRSLSTMWISWAVSCPACGITIEARKWTALFFTATAIVFTLLSSACITRKSVRNRWR